MPGGVIELTEGDEDNLRSWKRLPPALEVIGEEEKVTVLMFCCKILAVSCEGEGSRLTSLRGLKGKVLSTELKVMVRC